MARGSGSQDWDVLARVRRAPHGRAGYKQLVRELGLSGGRERRLLLDQLTRMVSHGELVQVEDEIWALPEALRAEGFRSQRSASGTADGARAIGRRPQSLLQNHERSGRERLVSGRLDLHRDGFGFVRPQERGGTRSEGEDIFIPPSDIAGAMQGDLVLVDENPPGRDGRRSGRIVRVLTRRHPTVVGVFHYGSVPVRRRSVDGFNADGIRGNFVRPFDERVAGWIEIPEGAEVVPAHTLSEDRTLGEEAEAQRRVLEPKDSRWPLEGMAVDVEITHFPSPGRPARGRVIEVLGPPDAFGVDVEIVIRKHHLPHTFPAKVLAEARKRAQESVATASEEELAGRKDFRGLPIVTIDGETAKDFDDAVLVRPLENGNTELQVHIADVSWYVQSETALDTEARLRGTSVYFPDRAVPMLPHALSSGMCSLLPEQDRMVLSCVMEIDARGEVVGYWVGEGIIRSVRRCTYTSVQRCLNAGNREQGNRKDVLPEATAEDIAELERVAAEQPELPEAFDAMLELALRLNAKRRRRGSIDFDLPEPVVEFDPDGNMKAIVRSERGWAHRLIEEFMLSANECVARWLEDQGIPSIYRIHEMPDPKRIVEFEETAAAFGQTLGIGALPVKRVTMKADRRDVRRNAGRGRGASGSREVKQHEIPEHIPVTPMMYQRLVRKISGHPEERILAYLMLRSLKQARYSEKNEGHFALASPSYTHFTSPIRRYPDLTVHRLVRAMLRSGADPQGVALRSDDWHPWTEEGQPGPKGQRANAHRGTRSSEPLAPGPHPSGPIPAEELSDIAVESSQAERRAADAERELIEWKKMKFMADKVGDEFKAIVLSVTKYGFYVELDELFIEGLVPIGSLAGDYYTFRDTDRTICGARTGHCFRVGERVEVILDRIDRQQRRLQFALVPGTEPKGSGLRASSTETERERPKKKSGGAKKKARLRKEKRRR
jgi:ribonuclease R